MSQIFKTSFTKKGTINKLTGHEKINFRTNHRNYICMLQAIYNFFFCLSEINPVEMDFVPSMT